MTSHEEAPFEPFLSVVVPAFNEAEVLPVFAARLRSVLDLGEPAYDVIIIDDGSSDETYEVLIDLAREWPNLRPVRLRRNVGHQAAITAGLSLADGRWVITMDADLQDPPELIPAMLEKAEREGASVVYARHNQRTHDSRFKKLTAALYYGVITRLTGIRVTPQAGDFRLVRHEVILALRNLPEQNKVYRLLIPWLGFKGTSIDFSRQARAAGKSKYPLSRMVRLGLDSLTAFSAAPLRLATYLGLGSVLLCFGLIGGALAAYAMGAVVPGWSSVFVAVLFIGAIQLMCLGLLGEYIGRLFAESRGRPVFSVDNSYGLSNFAQGSQPLDTVAKGSSTK